MKLKTKKNSANNIFNHTFGKKKKKQVVLCLIKREGKCKCGTVIQLQA